VPDQNAQHRLSVEKQRTVARIESLSVDVDSIDAGNAVANSDDEHDPEGSTLAFERARLSTLLNQSRANLEEIERAQDRLANGTYGTCELCGAPIPRERLAARPVARTCVQCRSDIGLVPPRDV
jgi:DnaK suppressor protein